MSERPRDLRVRVDHVGIAVEDRDHTSPILELLGGDVIADEAADGYRWILFELGDLSRIELIEPTAPDTFLTAYLERFGEGLHHVTLEVASLDDVVDHLDDHGVEVVDRTDRAGYREAFIPPGETGGVLFQLMEFGADYPERYGAPGVGDDLLVDRSLMESKDPS